MKKYILTILLFIVISCSTIPTKSMQQIGVSVIGTTIEILIEKYGQPDFNYFNRGTGHEFYVYGNKSLIVQDGIVIDVRVVR